MATRITIPVLSLAPMERLVGYDYHKTDAALDLVSKALAQVGLRIVPQSISVGKDGSLSFDAESADAKGVSDHDRL